MLLSLIVLPWIIFSVLPTLSISIKVNGVTATAAFVNEVVLVDIRASTGIHTAKQSNGSESVRIQYGDGLECNLRACTHVYSTTGTYTITVTATNSAGATIDSSHQITISEIPTATGGAVQNLTDSGNAATNKTNLQNAINAAAAANSVEQEIRLNGNWSTVINGSIVLTRPTGNKYITIIWTGLSSTRNKRISPANLANAPTIQSPSSIDVTAAALWTPNPATADPSHHYRLIGLQFEKNSSAQSQVLVSLGDANSIQNTLAEQPHHFIIERCYFTGGVGTSNLGLRVAADYVTVVDSYFDNFKVSTGVDAVAIGPQKGRGYWAFNNNFLEASSENFFVGGAVLEGFTGTISNPTITSATLSSVSNLSVDDNIALPIAGAYSAKYSTIVRSISGNNITFDEIVSAPDNGGTAKWAVTPSYMEFRRNYLKKPTAWRAGQPDHDGSNWQVKNLFEVKTARYMVIDGNIMENSWIKDQAYSLVFTVRYADFLHEAAVIREIQFSNNIVKNVANGFNITPTDNYGPTGLTQDITIRNNLFQNMGSNYDSAGGVHLLINLQSEIDQLGGRATLKRIYLIHNTHDNGTPDNSNGQITWFGANGGTTEGLWINNVHQDGGQGFRNGGATSAANITIFLPPGTSANWNKNLILNPTSDTYPTAAITQSAMWPSIFVNYAAGDFTLIGGNPGKNAATDGIDVGVDFSTLQAATANTISGEWVGSTSSPFPEPSPAPSPTPTPAPSPIPSPEPIPEPSPTPTIEYEAIDVLLPSAPTYEERLVLQDALLAALGEQGYGQCYGAAGGTRWYCLRAKNWNVKFSWKRWPWINGITERLNLANQVGVEGYSHVFLWSGQLRASRVKF